MSDAIYETCFISQLSVFTTGSAHLTLANETSNHQMAATAAGVATATDATEPNVNGADTATMNCTVAVTDAARATADACGAMIGA